MKKGYNTLMKIGMALGLCLAFGTASAGPITGEIDFSGGATMNTSSLATATQVVSWQNVTVNDVTEALDMFINDGDSVMMGTPWSFNAGKNMLWSVGGFTFDLMTSVVNAQSATFLNVQGSGTISGNGYDPTPGEWFFSSQGKSGNSKFSFSSSTEANPQSVPEGGMTVALLGAALLGMGLIHRKKGISNPAMALAA